MFGIKTEGTFILSLFFLWNFLLIIARNQIRNLVIRPRAIHIFQLHFLFFVFIFRVTIKLYLSLTELGFHFLNILQSYFIGWLLNSDFFLKSSLYITFVQSSQSSLERACHHLYEVSCDIIIIIYFFKTQRLILPFFFCFILSRFYISLDINFPLFWFIQ